MPDFDALIKVYLNNGNDLIKIQKALMGGQDYEYNYHKAVFNMKTLRDLLIECGFNSIQEWNAIDDFGTSIGDWSEGAFKSKIGRIPISLNLKAVK